jgi:unsaturated rhamnogalacturonyl hydrolase
MVNPFLARYGHTFNDATYADNETTKQLILYGKHLFAPNGLLRHAYDEKRQQPWANRTTGQSPEHWCRAIGWYGMATHDVLDTIAPDHPNRPALIDNLRRLVAAFAKYQDPKTGRWFQVVDKGSTPGNWTETSCSAMYTYTIETAVERGYVAESYRQNAIAGYHGVLAKVSKGSDGLTNIADICEGTNVGDLDYYLHRKRNTNDLHGLGAFVIMNERMRTVGG